MKKSDSPEQKEVLEWKSKYLRALADYQNLEKRVSAQRIEDIKYAARNLIVKLLSVLDVLEKAEKHINDQGLNLAVKSFKEILKDEQVTKIEVLQRKFNPQEMECVEVVVSDKEDEVIEEVRAGYKLADRVIRVAQVKVGKKKS